MLSDLRFALRQFSRCPGFTFVAVLTLTLGIGATTAVFSLLNIIWLRPLSYPEPERIVEVTEVSLKSNSRISVSYPNFIDWKEQQKCFEAFAFFKSQFVNLVTAGGTERIRTTYADHDFFRAYGVEPAQGRNFQPSDNHDSSPVVAIVTHDAWQSRFGANPGLVGSQLRIDGRSATVIGILPKGFKTYQSAEVFVPIAPFAGSLFLLSRDNHSDSYVLGRLAKRATLPSAQAEMAAIAANLERLYPSSNKGNGIVLTPLRERISGRSSASLPLLLGAVGMVLLIACVNVANMLLSRASVRGKEMAIRSALGARRGRLIRQLLTESLLLSSISAFCGLYVGHLLFGLMGALLPYEVRSIIDAGASDLDWRIALFSLSLALVTGVAFGLVPAFQASEHSQADALKDRGLSNRARVGGFRISDILVITEVALAAMLLIGATLLIRSLWSLRNENLGFDHEQLLTVRIAHPGKRLGDMAILTQLYYEEAARRVSVLPGVESVSIVNHIPFSYSNSTIVYYLPDRPMPADGEFFHVSNRSCDPNYLKTMGISLIKGRTFALSEHRPNLPPGQPTMAQVLAAYKDFVMEGVVSNSFAQKHWPGENPLGKRIRLGNSKVSFGDVEIVGVAADATQQAYGQRSLEEIYLPFRQYSPPLDFGLVIRTRDNPAALAKATRETLLAHSKDDPVYDIQTQSRRIEGTISGRAFNSQLFAFFAAAAVLLSLVGIYGVIAFSVSRRTREIGIRIALGARDTQIVRSILQRGVVLAAIGISLGLMGAWLASRLIQNQLYGVSATDASIYCLTACAILVAATAACLIPARKATKVDPVIALRSE